MLILHLISVAHPPIEDVYLHYIRDNLLKTICVFKY